MITISFSKFTLKRFDVTFLPYVVFPKTNKWQKQLFKGGNVSQDPPTITTETLEAIADIYRVANRGEVLAQVLVSEISILITIRGALPATTHMNPSENNGLLVLADGG